MTKKGSYTCIFGGGAIRGIAYIGALQAINELELVIDTLAGSSVGSIVATLVAVGYSPDEISDIFMQVNFELFRDIHFGLNKDFAISKGNVFTDWIRDLIEKKFYGDDYKKGQNKPVLFGNIDRNLVLITTDLNTFKPYEFSTFETPDFEIAEAVRISCSMPGLMVPIEINNKKLVDGDLMKGIPLWKLSKNLNNPKNRIIEFRLEGDNVGNNGNAFEFLNSIYSCMTSVSTDFIMDCFGDNDKYDYVKITTGDLIVIDFNIPQKIRNKLIEIGYSDSLKYLTQHFKEKKSVIIDTYSKLIQLLDELHKSLKLDNVIEANEDLKDVFLYLADKQKYIDADIYESLIALKNDIQNAPIKRGWFKQVKFKNKTLLLNSCDILKKIIDIKCQELENFVSCV